MASVAKAHLQFEGTNQSTPKRPFAKASQQPLRTSGQLDPNEELLASYTQFPTSVSGSTVWAAEDYSGNSERWTHTWDEAEIRGISDAAEQFIKSGKPLSAISKERFVLPNSLDTFLDSVRREIINGKGFILFKGFPVDIWGIEKSAVAYMGVGTRLGNFVSQNSRGHVLGHVKDLGEDATKTDSVRIYRTNARQFFHSDDCDVVGLLCLARAQEGGESDMVSSHHVFNTLQRERPDVVETLTRPNWYFDRKGEVSKGQREWIKAPVFYYYEGRVITKWDPYYVTSLSRFSSKGLIPPLSPAQLEAASVLEDTCRRLSLHMILEVGDIQFLSNNHIFHARTAYIDALPPAKRRHLMRLWLATPEAEGGWKLPFEDSTHVKRGGVQVDDTKEVAPLDGE